MFLLPDNLLTSYFIS